MVTFLSNLFFGSPKDESEVVAVVHLRGSISPDGKDTISADKSRELLYQAFTLDKVQAVILVINSPGGAPTQTNLIGTYIREMAEETNVPVYAVVEDMAASGGYWLACAADEIYVDANSMVGSIGVIFSNVGVQAAMKKASVEPRVITTGKNKAGLHTMLDYDKEQAALVTRHLAIVHGLFIDWVRKRRPQLKEASKTSDVFSGRVYVGREAVDKGLADGEADLTKLMKNKFPDKYQKLKVVDIKKKDEQGLPGIFAHLFNRGSHALDLTEAYIDSFRIRPGGQYLV